MGCDIHIWAERKSGSCFEVVHDTEFSYGTGPFGWRCYAMFGFLAGVRNYSAVRPISEPRGFPSDISDEAFSDLSESTHSASWLSVSELLAVDYEQEIEDRRVTVQTGSRSWIGSATCDPGQGEKMPLEKFLGPAFFKDLHALKHCGADRIVFSFDS